MSAPILIILYFATGFVIDGRANVSIWMGEGENDSNRWFVPSPILILAWPLFVTAVFLTWLLRKVGWQ